MSEILYNARRRHACMYDLQRHSRFQSGGQRDTVYRWIPTLKLFTNYIIKYVLNRSNILFDKTGFLKKKKIHDRNLNTYLSINDYLQPRSNWSNIFIIYYDLIMFLSFFFFYFKKVKNKIFGFICVFRIYWNSLSVSVCLMGLRSEKILFSCIQKYSKSAIDSKQKLKTTPFTMFSRRNFFFFRYFHCTTNE